MKFNELKDRLDEMAEELRDSATAANPSVFGLGMRVGYRLYITEAQDAILVAKHNDRTLQYYGGFEYVDKDYRLELGAYVLYSADDPRVAKHINIALDAMEDDEPDMTPEDGADLRNDARRNK